ncbi:MAG: hypothetical protein OEM26_15995 [Saprospiraceae bacterium]|nr:hypothetical protein [Saprospiraceae bacterium]
MSTEKGNQAYYDPGLVDKGWDEMRKILDKEMPQRKKRYLFWLPMLAGVMMIIATLFYLYQPDDSIPVEADKSTIQLIPAEQIPVQQDPAIKAAPLEEDEVKWDRASLNKGSMEEQSGSGTFVPGNSTSSPDVAVAEPSPTPSSSKSLKPEIQYAENKAIEGGVLLESEMGPTEDSDSKKEEVTVNIDDDALALEDQQQAQNEPSRLVNQQLINPISQFRAKELSPAWTYPIESHLLAAQADETIEKQRSGMHLSFGVSAGLISDHSLSDFSWTSGAEVSLEINRILALSTGLHYWQIKSDRFFLSESVSNFADEAKDFTLQDPSQMADIERMGGTNVSAGSADQRLAGQTGRLRYLRVPLTIQFFPDAVWQPHIGISSLFLLTASSMNQEFALSAVDQINANLQISTVSNFVRKRNLVYELGLSFQPVKNLMFDLTYGLENKSYLNYSVSGSGFSELHRYWRLSGSYRF